MRLAWAFLTLCFLAVSAGAADPVYIDELMETPLPALQQQFPGLRKEGCYQIGDGRYLLIDINKHKSHNPWRVAISAVEPCRRPFPISGGLDLHERRGVELGDRSIDVVEKMGRPDASADPEEAMRRLGDTEYFYICRISEGCTRHTSVFIREGLVTAIAEWYSE